MRDTQQEIVDEAEGYFIQMLFTKNRNLLRRGCRKIYDALFDRYFEIYRLGKEVRVDLSAINERFFVELGIQKVKRRANKR